MNADDPQQVLRITLDEVERVASADISPLPQQSSPGAKSYGNIAQPADPVLAQEKGSILPQTWFYLGSAGLVGSLLGWGLAERGFVDGERSRWGNTWMVPIIVTLMCVGFAVTESLIERSGKKVLTQGALSLPLGIAFGFVFDAVANTFYALALAICSAAGAQTFHNPAVWLARGFAWAVFGAAGGIVYGIVGRSMKKTAFGVLSGAIGAVLGSTIFDPISFATHGGAASRAIGFGLLGLATGVGMGLVENALKDRWLYVTAGPLAGNSSSCTSHRQQ